MTQEEKTLLIKDICGRILYSPKGVILYHLYDPEEVEVCGYDGQWITVYRGGDFDNYDAERIRLYLRPMSSMTKEEKEELCKLCNSERVLDEETQEYLYTSYYIYFGSKEEDCEEDETVVNPNLNCCSPFDWLNAHHFDYRGLIPMGLALEAPEGMYKKD